MITVIIPCFNAEKTILRALHSVLEQSKAHLIKEIIIVDDCSTDRTLEVIQNSYGPIEVFGISDDVKRAGVLFSNLKITWVTSSDTWNADEALSAMASAPILVASNSGLALFGGLLSIHPNPSIFFPKVPNNEHWRPHSNEILSQRWNLVSAYLWYPET
jgi:glycosyltransferase involved in cell wall biosynthesis